MNLIDLTAISPIDGRYRSKVSELDKFFSEFALIKYRVLVEVEYFIQLCEINLPALKNIDKKRYVDLRNIYNNFSLIDAERIKNIESTTNHDVKAVEYFLREKFTELNLSPYNEFIHFGLTSQDINNTATPLLLKEAMLNVYFPLIAELVNDLSVLVENWKNISMLARTHGQPASPTKLGKEINVFVERIKVQMLQIKTIPFSAKFGGATGNFNAHYVAYPSIDWVKFGNDFVNHTLGLSRSQTTTQIEHYDNLAALFDGLKRINTILIDLDRDFWTYISMEYFKQKIKKDEVGSSAMPHKVNPIDFENSEGNLGFANAIFEHLSAKLPISRLQRDLTDSTVLRNVGVPFAHTILAIKSLQKGLSKLVLNEKAIKADLEDNWSVVAEAIQTILRREGFENPYNELKKLTRTNEMITKEAIQHFIETLNVSENIKKELHNITPFNYTGIN
ncbi:MAG TPA: adenylosuccinate lyase [Bacteroidales bacterium]|nr:MAG: adenylosuccinate lyase [Bacteroidetes bacterium GWF2_33_38]OFY74803.1 MAG: adenylosuccinate lyase [Bacteroidetes bacterium RIFOXYA12_FULL_33_9]OFY89918.1 MAG: adenylosuccinate lyase [Bacteroidetes bacterium RIFOXYA2_FULL_33_7]HBF88825.1 adenylosuccinate lyase [Bacteroidales bacterium]